VFMYHEVLCKNGVEGRDSKRHYMKSEQSAPAYFALCQRGTPTSELVNCCKIYTVMNCLQQDQRPQMRV
jgi:hypothetical protein